jgi:hypothetical protein
MLGELVARRRDWRDYNESLVKRGELYLTFNFLETWQKDLDKLNQGKLGRKYESPWSFIEFMMLIHVIFGLPYRQLEGFLRTVSEFVPQIKPTDYTTIWRRGTKLRIKLSDLVFERAINLSVSYNAN